MGSVPMNEMLHIYNKTIGDKNLNPKNHKEKLIGRWVEQITHVKKPMKLLVHTDFPL